MAGIIRHEAYPFQEELNKLIAHGFAVLDQRRTELWAHQADQSGYATYHSCYVWTPPGRAACFRFSTSTPMAWAEAMQKRLYRHCVICGRDCVQRHTAAHRGDVLCVCTRCGLAGYGLKDIPEIESPYRKGKVHEQAPQD